MYRPRGKDWRKQKQIVTPEFMTINLPYNVGQRLRFFGSENQTFADILTGFMDAGDKISRLEKVAGPKRWSRENSSEYLKLLPTRQQDE